MCKVIPENEGEGTFAVQSKRNIQAFNEEVKGKFKDYGPPEQM